MCHSLVCLDDKSLETDTTGFDGWPAGPWTRLIHKVTAGKLSTRKIQFNVSSTQHGWYLASDTLKVRPACTMELQVQMVHTGTHLPMVWFTYADAHYARENST